MMTMMMKMYCVDDDDETLLCTLMIFFLLSHDVFHYTTVRFTVGRMEGDNFGHSLVLFY